MLGLAARAVRAGVDPARIVIDPAHDFGKNTWHSLEITRRLGELTATGWPVLMAASRKDFVGETLGAAVEDRLAGTLGGDGRGRLARRPDLPRPRRARRPGRRCTWWRRSAVTLPARVRAGARVITAQRSARPRRCWRRS